MTTSSEQEIQNPRPKRPTYVPAYRISLVREPSVRMEDRPQLRDAPAAVRAIHALRAGHDDGVEHFGVLLLDVRHRIIGALELSVGCLTGALVHPRGFWPSAGAQIRRPDPVS